MAAPQQLLRQAVQLHQAGNLARAEQLYEKVLSKAPRNADALYLLGTIHAQRGSLQKAVPLFEKALRERPDHAAAVLNLATACLNLGRYDEAVEGFRKALRGMPRNPDVLNGLGAALKAKGEFEQAADCYRNLIRLNPDAPGAHGNLGMALAELKRYDQAEQSLLKAISLNPNDGATHYNLGNVYLDQDLNAKATAHFTRAAELLPGHPNVHYNLGNALYNLGRYEEAAQHFGRAIDLDPGNLKCYHNRVNALVHAGDYAALEETYAAAWKVAPDRADIHEHMLLNLLYIPGKPAKEIAEAHRQWGNAHMARLGGNDTSNHPNEPDPERPLRVGYVSPDLRAHPVAFFMEPVLAHYDRDAVSITCYANVENPDRVTERIRPLVDGWCDIWGMSDEQVAERIRADRIDILVDLAGHTANTRTPMLALKPAPVQVIYLGYPATSGLSTVDFRLTDRWADPEDDNRWDVETAIRIEDGLCCYAPPPGSPDPGPLPARANGHVTFGSLMNPLKINPQVVELWARVLEAVPGSRLLLCRNTYRSETERERILSAFERCGTPRERVTCTDATDEGADPVLARYTRMDISLDTFPYAGHTTTCEALYMGVPVITLAGDSYVSRVGVSMLSMVDLEEWVAQDKDAYVALAAGLAADLDRLEAVRSGLRRRVLDSPLGDQAGFARRLESAFRAMWRQWCASRAEPR